MTRRRWTRGLYPFWILMAVAMGGQMLFPAKTMPAQSSSLIKVAYLYNFAKFVEWPPAAFDEGQTSFSLCVLGTDSFVGSLPSIQGKPIKSRKLSIQYFKHVANLKACHILFVSVSERHQVDDIVASLQDQPILSVADMETFTRSGGMINFMTTTHKIQFAINAKSAQRAGLHIRSKLLKLAHIVDEDSK